MEDHLSPSALGHHEVNMLMKSLLGSLKAPRKAWECAPIWKESIHTDSHHWLAYSWRPAPCITAGLLCWGLSYSTSSFVFLLFQDSLCECPTSSRADIPQPRSTLEKCKLCQAGKLCFSFNYLLLHLEPSVKLWQQNAPPRDSATFESNNWDAILNSLSPPTSWRKPPHLPCLSCLMKDSFCLRNNVSYCLE